jgi:hypothetical protein
VTLSAVEACAASPQPHQGHSLVPTRKVLDLGASGLVHLVGLEATEGTAHDRAQVRHQDLEAFGKIDEHIHDANAIQVQAHRHRVRHGAPPLLGGLVTTEHGGASGLPDGFQSLQIRPSSHGFAASQLRTR